MGIFDKIKEFQMRLKKPAPEAPKVVLDESQMDDWADKLVGHMNLNKDFKDFNKRVEELQERARKVVKKFTDEGILSAIPERARTVNAVHGKEYAGQALKLLKSTKFSTLFSFEEDQHSYMDANGKFKEQTSNNVSALKEFMHGELQEVQSIMQELEDEVIAFMKTLEDKQFDQISKIRTAQAEMERIDVQREQYQTLMKTLEEDHKKTAEKRNKIEEGIEKNRILIRNEQSLKALQKLSELEEELDGLTRKYESACKDVVKYCQKQSITLGIEAKRIVSGLPKDPEQFIPQHEVGQSFADIVELLESEGRGKIGNLIDRLRTLSETAGTDGKRIQEIAPEQRELKKDILRDVAALSIYDQQQFLIRAKREEHEIKAKLDFLNAEVSSHKRLEKERAMKDAAIALGATVTGEPDNILEQEESSEEEIEESSEEPNEERENIP